MKVLFGMRKKNHDLIMKRSTKRRKSMKMDHDTIEEGVVIEDVIKWLMGDLTI